MPNTLTRRRSLAFTRQHGLCCYCGLPMWVSRSQDFAVAYGLTPKQAALLQCTAEHLQARQDGGGNSQANIAAACRHCNALRHQRPSPPDPDTFRKLVRSRVAKMRWHQAQVIERLMKAAPHCVEG